MEQAQILAALAGERQRQAEELKGLLRSSEERWQASQDTMLRQHGELMVTMQEQAKIFAQILQQSTTQPMRPETPSIVSPTMVGANQLTNLNLCKIGPGDAPDDFLASFERIAVAAGWPREQWVVRLLPCLAGESLAAFQTLGPEHADSYLTVKAHILDYLGYTNEHYRQRFRATQMLPSERPKALLQRITKLAEKWLLPCLNDARALFAEVLKEQLLEAVPKNLKLWVKRQNCKTLGQVLEVAEAYIDSQEPVGEGSGGIPGYSLRQSPGDQNKKNPLKDPALPAPRPITQGNQRKCYRCGKIGHTQRMCRERRDFVIKRVTDRADTSKSQVPVWVAGKKIMALLDTGAEQSVISRQMWKQIECPPFRKEGLNEVAVRCVHGDARRYPLTNISLEHNREKYNLPVAVVQSCPFPVILGRDWPGWEKKGRLARPWGNNSLTKSQYSAKCVLGTQVKGGCYSNREGWKRRQSSFTSGRPGWRPTLRWVPLSEKAKVPTQAYSKAAGFDIYAAYEQIVPAKGRATLKTDIQVAPPPGSYIRIGPRSGLAAEHSLDVAAGIIDPDYRGNVGVLLVNHGNSDYQVHPGEKIAQLICERIWFPKLERWEHLKDTSRGEKGFGSSDRRVTNNPQTFVRDFAGENLQEELQAITLEHDTRKQVTEEMGNLRQEIAALKNEVQVRTKTQEARWKEELATVHAQWVDEGIKSNTKRSQDNSELLSKLGETLKQEISAQTQRHSHSIEESLDQVKSQLRELESKTSNSHAQQQELQSQFKKIQTSHELWATEGMEPDSLAKQGRNNKSQLEQQAIQLGTVADSVKRVGGSVNNLQEQIQERVEEIAQVLTAITVRVEGLEGSEACQPQVVKNPEPAVLHWPEDFENLCADPRPEEKRFRNRRHK
uniref:dUTP diphosphatase n=1 Tax=Geotrypetes seraphini TaxID=260995 RepID=A0A6P8R451_GEOSA|nr:uncharacterized protein LOC117357181 [Geotrypetes seraphini]